MERLPGKAQVHVTSCRNLGKHNVPDCGCPTRLSFATVDSYIGKLRAIFKDAGRGRKGGGVELATGTPLFLWGALRLLLRFKTILQLFRPSSFICPVSFWEDCVLLVSPIPNSSFIRETPPCLRRCFLAVT